MPSELNPEPVLAKVKELLSGDGYAAQLNLVNLEFGDHLVLTPLYAVNIEGIDGPTAQYPSAVIYDQDPEIVKYSGMVAVWYLAQIDFWDRCNASGMFEMAKRLWRYRQAAVRTLRSANSGGVWSEVHVREVVSSPVFQQEGQDIYIRAKGLLMAFKSVEDY